MTALTIDLPEHPAMLRRVGGLRADATDAAVVARTVWSVLVEPGDGVAGRLVDALGPLPALEVALRGDVAGAEGVGVTAREASEAFRRWGPRMDEGAVVSAVESAARAGIRLVVPGDEEWPRGLDDLGSHAPLCLWVRGDPGALVRTSTTVALVGARAATSYGDSVAMELAADLANRGAGIVSGGAYGIDGSAHRATLAAGGTTIAILAGGADRSYPAGHTEMFGRIAATGAVVSEVPCGGAPTKWRFLQRNRLIAALGAATVVVEAGWRSGSLNTAGHAAALGRPLGAVPGPITSAASAGCHRLLREFNACCVTSVDDVLEMLGEAGVGHRHAAAVVPPEQTRVRDALSDRSPRDADDIARRVGMSVEQVESVLGMMALEGFAVRGDGGWRRTRA